MKYTAEAYEGRKVGRFNCYVGVQIVATDDTGKRRYVFTQHGQYRTYKTPCLKTWEGVAHYKSGLNARDGAEFSEAMQSAQKDAATWTQAGALK